MALPKYDRTKRRQNFPQLPKGAYVLKILYAKEEPNRNGSGTHLVVSYDIAEGEYKDYFLNLYNSRDGEDKKWPADGQYYLTVPSDNVEAYVWTNWNSFFAYLEDSNNGFVFGGDPAQLKGKLIGSAQRVPVVTGSTTTFGCGGPAWLKMFARTRRAKCRTTG